MDTKLLLLIKSLLYWMIVGALFQQANSFTSEEFVGETESLDSYICLRANGFFPHDLRCDHFYECRNGTIINEGICKQGLRFDYRYRKKPRCIVADQIDCRITQVELYGLVANGGQSEVGPFGEPASPITTLKPPSNTRRGGSVLPDLPPVTNAPTTTTPTPIIITTTTAVTPKWAPTIPPLPGTTTTTSNSRSSSHRHSTNHLEEEKDNALTKKRKLVKKPVKLRRGHLQEQPSSPTTGGLDDPLSFHDQLLPRAVSSAQYEGRLGRPKSIHCPHRNGYYADREDCRKFYACDDGRAFPMSCPLGLAYDEMTGTCAWPDMVEGCRSEEMLRFTCPEPNENEILDYGDPRYPTSDCRKFVVCVVSELYGSRTPRLLGCEEGLVFNPHTRACDYPENVPSCANYYDEMDIGHHHSHQSSTAASKRRRQRL